MKRLKELFGAASLRRRITGATTIAVATVCVIFGIASYFSLRSKLYGNVRDELISLTQPYLDHNYGRFGFRAGQNGTGTTPKPTGTGTKQTGTTPSAGAPTGGGGAGTPDSPTADECTEFHRTGTTGAGVPLGGARGYFQNVCPDGKAYAIDGSKPRLPITARVIKVANHKAKNFFFTSHVNGTEEEIYVAADTRLHKAVEAALPLNSVNSTLSGLLLTYVLLIAAAIFAAGLIGAWIAQSALAPIRRFTSETEQVTSALSRPRRLEEQGADELRRLAASFNQTLDALERSVQAQQHLIADASHELRTPMAALRSNIQIFLEAERLPIEDREELQSTIVAELDDLTQLVADVLSLARGAPADEHVEPLELETIVREEVDRAKRRSPNLKFEVELDPTTVNNSPDRVSRAVANVIDNARKWSPDGGLVEVRLINGELSVRDHGPGFKDEDMERVFERFYRSADARRMPGSGLGLAIVQQAAEAHGGHARVANADGGGAVVTVAFSPPDDPDTDQS